MRFAQAFSMWKLWFSWMVYGNPVICWMDDAFQANNLKSCFTGNVFKEDVTLCYKYMINVDVSRMRLIYALHFPECYTCLCKILKLFIRKSYPHVKNTFSIMHVRYTLMSRFPYRASGMLTLNIFNEQVFSFCSS